MTSLQFDDDRIVSGGSDGRVKVWDTRTGQLVRELSQPAEAVWRVAFESEVAVVMASRGGRTIMEVWNFEPPAEEWELGPGGREVSRSGGGGGGRRDVVDTRMDQGNDHDDGDGDGDDDGDEEDEIVSERTSADVVRGIDDEMEE